MIRLRHLSFMSPCEARAQQQQNAFLAAFSCRLFPLHFSPSSTRLLARRDPCQTTSSCMRHGSSDKPLPTVPHLLAVLVNLAALNAVLQDEGPVAAAVLLHQAHQRRLLRALPPLGLREGKWQRASCSEQGTQWGSTWAALTLQCWWRAAHIYALPPPFCRACQPCSHLPHTLRRPFSVRRAAPPPLCATATGACPAWRRADCGGSGECWWASTRGSCGGGPCRQGRSGTRLSTQLEG